MSKFQFGKFVFTITDLMVRRLAEVTILIDNIALLPFKLLPFKLRFK
jgi:hypothetical protein